MTFTPPLAIRKRPGLSSPSFTSTRSTSGESRTFSRRSTDAVEKKPWAIVDTRTTSSVSRGVSALEEELGVRLLRLGDEVTRRHRKGSSVRAITAELRGRFPDDVLDALATFPEPKAPTEIVRVKARELRLGMVVAEDVMIRDGAVLVPSGQEVTMALLERIHHRAQRHRRGRR